ncbi:hypothetical protein GQ607_009836, partial [Colletotrichum asianum]
FDGDFWRCLSDGFSSARCGDVEQLQFRRHQGRFTLYRSPRHNTAKYPTITESSLAIIRFPRANFCWQAKPWPRPGPGQEKDAVWLHCRADPHRAHTQAPPMGRSYVFLATNSALKYFQGVNIHPAQRPKAFRSVAETLSTPGVGWVLGYNHVTEPLDPSFPDLRTEESAGKPPRPWVPCRTDFGVLPSSSRSTAAGRIVQRLRRLRASKYFCGRRYRKISCGLARSQLCLA